MALNDNTVAGNFWGSNGGMPGKPLFAKDLFSYLACFRPKARWATSGPFSLMAP